MTVADALHMMAAQAIFWGLVIAASVSDYEQLVPFALAAPFAGAYWVWIAVRIINRHDDPRHLSRPPDAP
jgi:hypothetical protein